jgi:pimeloyl-ACP methyl ester carboxylesterase
VTVPAADEEGVSDGLAYVVYLPDEPPLGGVVILHGAGSAKESHLDFARRCRAAGLAALAFDARGHGASGGRMDGRAVEDVAAMAALLRERLGSRLPIGLRGSSMGGWFALVAAAGCGASAVVAICPASGAGLRRGLRDGRFSFASDRGTLDPLLAAHDERRAAAALGGALLLLHAEGDEVVPVELSRELHAAAPGSRLIAVPGGHHRSVQHDAELQGEAVRFLAKRLGG